MDLTTYGSEDDVPYTYCVSCVNVKLSVKFK